VRETEQENGEIPEAKQGGDPPIGKLCKAMILLEWASSDDEWAANSGKI
jgi:hypothetical protein